MIKVGLIGNEIIQSRAYIDPNVSSPPPDLNYRNTFPITVFDAVRELMGDENSITLREVLDRIHKELDGLQPLIPAKSSNYLMTYAGTPGGLGSIEISREIPWDKTEQRDDRIPTEKAVGDLMFKLGLINENGEAIDPEARKINWTDVIGRPNVYNDIGDNVDGFMTQKSVTTLVKEIKESIVDLDTSTTSRTDDIESKINDHILNKDNPHNVSIYQIGAASQKEFLYHLNDEKNPHNITAEILGLGNVNNTSDLDKPISNATQDAIESLNTLISNLTGNVEDINGVIDVEYDNASGNLKLSYMNGSDNELQLPLARFFDKIEYNKETKSLVVTEYGESLSDSPGNHIHEIDLSELFIRYLGSISDNIEVIIDGSQASGNQIVRASIVPKSITDNDISDNTLSERVIMDSSISTKKIKDAAITTDKISDSSITTSKISDNSITNDKLDNRSVNGRTLFTSIIANRVLVAYNSGDDPCWGQINGEMIKDDSIESRHIKNGSVDTSNIANGAISTSKLAEESVSNDKLAPNAITSEKIANWSITGENIQKSVKLYGTPSITVRPSPDSNDSSIPDTRWIRDYVASAINKTTDFGSRMVDGKMLFSSPYKNRVLAVLRANGDAEWTLVNHDMIDANAVGTNNIMNLSIDSDKIKDRSIFARHLTREIVNEENIIDSAVTSEKIFTSNLKNMVLAALSENGHPVYTKVTRDMMEYNAIGSMQIEDRSIILSKLQTADTDNKVLAVNIRNTDPIWTQVGTRMIADRAVTGKKLFTSSEHNSVIGVAVAGDDPRYMKVNSEMLEERLIKRQHIGKAEIWQEHLQEKIIDSRHIMDWSIKSNNIAHRAITGIELFSSPVPNRVLAVTTMPNSNADWLQVTGDMIEDNTITPEKLFSSIHSNRVLGVKKGGSLPEYIQLTADFIEDGSIVGSKLSKNIILKGTPRIEEDPLDFVNNNQIPTTRWVRNTISSMMESFSPQQPSQMEIPDGSIGIEKFKPTKQVGVLTSRESFGTLEFTPITEDIISNGAVTTNKLGRSLMLLGNPTLEVRPSATASDKHLNGNLIPDCQWVLDRINEVLGGGTTTPGYSEMWEMDYDTVLYNWKEGYTQYLSPDSNEITQGLVTSIWDNNGIGSINNDENELSYVTVLDIWNSKGVGDTSVEKPSTGGSTGGSTTLVPGSISSEMIGRRAITADKLFSSTEDNQVLAVIDANTDPVYTKITGDMIYDGSITFDKLQQSDDTDVILAVINPDLGIQYTKITGRMIEPSAISTRHISNGSITSEKIADHSIDHTKIVKDSFVDEDMIMDKSISTQKLKDSAIETNTVADGAITNDKIASGTITGDKLKDDIELPGKITVSSNKEYSIRQVRNTILSNETPSIADNGDIWFRFI